MRPVLAALALVLGTAPAAGNAAVLIEIPAENGIRLGDVWDISADGLVLVGDCGIGVGDGGPCRWSAPAGYELLERPPRGGSSWALATSRDGSVVVGSWDSTTAAIAVRWGADGQAHPLEPSAGSLGSEAWAVSADGSVIAGWKYDGNQHRAFRWTEATGMVMAPGGGFAFGVSADGSTVAACCVPSRFSHWPDVPFLWRPGAEPQPLPMIHRSGDMAYGLSADGKVALLAPRDYGVVGFAWRWSAKEGAQPVVKPRPSLLSPRPHDASADGSVIVGTTDYYFGSGFLWRAEAGDRLLRDVLADAGVDVSGWNDFVDSRAISDDGCRVPATGVRSNGEQVAVLLVLCGDDVGSAPPVHAPAAPLGLAIVVLLAIPFAIAARKPLGLALLLGLPGAAQGAGLVPLDGVTSAEELSGDGAVVAGRCSGAEKGRLCRWRPATGVEWLETPAGFVSIEAISFDGSTVVGSRTTGSWERAVLWNAAGEMEDLSGAPDLLSSQALHVSADGSVVLGAAYILLTPSTAVWRPFRWTRGAGMELLPFDGAHPVQASGDGNTLLVQDGIDAFLWRIGEAPIPISGPGGAPFHATALSADGNTVAGAENFYPGGLPLRWTAAEGAATLGPIAYPFLLSPIPLDASADGAVVVGSDDEVAGAFVWDAARGLHRLGDLLAGAHGVNVSAWDFSAVSRVSDDGLTALATGYENGAYKSVLVKLAPACDDGLDNDADGLIDLADPHCPSPSHPSERRPGCGLGFELALLLPLLAPRARRRG